MVPQGGSRSLWVRFCDRRSQAVVLWMSGGLLGNFESRRCRMLLWSRLDVMHHERDGHLSRWQKAASVMWETRSSVLRVAALEVISVTDQTETVRTEGSCHASGYSLCEGQWRKCGCWCWWRGDIGSIYPGRCWWWVEDGGGHWRSARVVEKMDTCTAGGRSWWEVCFPSVWVSAQHIFIYC